MLTILPVLKLVISFCDVNKGPDLFDHYIFLTITAESVTPILSWSIQQFYYLMPVGYNWT